MAPTLGKGDQSRVSARDPHRLLVSRSIYVLNHSGDVDNRERIN